MAKFSRFDLRNKKRGRHKALSKGGSMITQRPTTSKIKLLDNVADGLHPPFGLYYERKIHDGDPS